jgi:hypothetical protein
VSYSPVSTGTARRSLLLVFGESNEFSFRWNSFGVLSGSEIQSKKDVAVDNDRA